MPNKCYRCGRDTDSVVAPTITETDEQPDQTTVREYCCPGCFAREHGFVYPAQRDYDGAAQPIPPFWDSGIRMTVNSGTSQPLLDHTPNPFDTDTEVLR